MMRRYFRTTAAAAIAVLAGAGALVTAPLAAASPVPAAAGLVHVTSFGSNPGALSMFTYTPRGLTGRAPLVVALHGCSQTADDYFTHAGWRELADTYRFAVVFPQQESTNNTLSCFNWFLPADSTRNAGEALSVKQMIDYEKAHRPVDAGQVFVTGLSAGGAMTADLLADYPDVFAGGGIDAGVAAQCATNLVQALACQETDQHLTPAQWAARVQASDPGWKGPWPRVAIWQGTADTTVMPVNATELRDQWTAVHGVSQTPTSTTALTGGTTRTGYRGPDGRAAVALFLIAGMGHGTAVHPGSGVANCGVPGQYYPDYICSSYYTARFWGLTAR